MSTAETHATERFASDTAKHQLAVLHEDGLYRHLRAKNPKNGAYWFDVITWPGCLTIRGDLGNSYTFARLPDMFEFFRGKRINPHYWSEKLDGDRNSVQVYSEDLFRQLVVEHFVDSVRFSDAPRGLGKAIRAEILDQDLTFEDEARSLLEDFEFKGFEFHDVWEWSFSDYDWVFLWACHAIVWAIAAYDRAKAEQLAPALDRHQPRRGAAMSPQRFQRRRTKGWRTPLDANGQAARYVGRGSRFGNPARLVHASHGLVVEWLGGGTVGTWPNEADARKFATDLFEHWINEPEQAELRSLARSLLAGRDLLCWCPLPEPGQPDHCHAAVLLRLAADTTGGLR